MVQFPFAIVFLKTIDSFDSESKIGVVGNGEPPEDKESCLSASITIKITFFFEYSVFLI
ncbi:hypothetical protein LEP1GSC043_0520 [Leptospira weilii str. Ecochallenge]|uniref:Uncharacterized protein n=1 Tax=Leptospira weilii str. Ecochallenge TaxID=1049986 RepID=N1U6V6_9LEPT|nr:hypothetical protein LEP1GSC043_0520 [Leptospira weilii str. Ecochallenge]